MLVIDIGPADKTEVAVTRIGRSYSAIERQAIVKALGCGRIVISRMGLNGSAALSCRADSSGSVT